MASELAFKGKPPTFEDAIALYNSGDAATARALFEALLANDPLSVPILVSLGMSCWQVGDFRSSEDYLEKAIAIQPRNENAFRALGMLYNSKNDFEKAIKALKRCVEISPQYPQGWLTLGLVQQRLELLDDAEHSYAQAVQLNPRYVEALNNLATIRLAHKDYNECRSLVYRALAERPTHIDAYRTLARMYRDVGVDREALVLLHRAVRIDPKATHAWNELGSIYRDMSDTPKSIAAYRMAVEVAPTNVDAKANLTCVLSTDGAFEESRQLCDELLTIQPDQMGVRFRKAIVIPAIMDTVEQIDRSREQILTELEDLSNHPGKIGDPLGQIGATNFYLAYHGRNDREIQQKTSEALLKVCPTLDYVAPHIGRTRKPGRIRVGVCSRHLSRHTIGVLWGEYFARLDREKFELFLFHTLPVFNGIPEALKERVDHEVRVPINLDGARKAIARCELDIMYYTDIGMEPLTWFLSFSRLAPTQAVTWGHPLTTGVPNMDYFISSKHLEIADPSDHYSEKCVRLPTLNTFYLRPELEAQMSRAHFGIREDSTLYVCPQTLFKLHPDIDGVFRRILEEDAKGELLLIEGTSAMHTTLIKERFKRTLSDLMDRIVICPRQSHQGFLAMVSMADVMLDPIHFGGGSTTLQALSFGTPVVTLPSEFLRGRISHACYKEIGVDSLIASDTDDYCARAVALGRDKEYRESVRAEIRERSQALYSNERVIREFEGFLEQAASGTRVDHVVEPKPKGKKKRDKGERR